MTVKTCISCYWQQMVVGILAFTLFCFWFFFFPFVPITREMSVLFLWNSDYLIERLVIPGGLAQYLGEGISQFFLNPFNGALCYALLFISVQWLSAKWVRQLLPRLHAGIQFVLSLLPPAILWYLAMLPDIPLTPTIATLLVLAVGIPIMQIPLQSPYRYRVIALCLLIPIMYWLTGPIALLLILCCIRWAPLTFIVFVASLFGSSYVTPYPLEKIIQGIDYCWSGDKAVRNTYEEMECDMLIRMNDWDTILRKFHSPESPAVRSAVYYAAYKNGQLSYQDFMSLFIASGERRFREPTSFSVDGMYFVVSFGSLSSAFMFSDLSYRLYWSNIAQRTAFDAMEYIANNNKSARAFKRLIEIGIITKQYALAKKYISIMEETTFYRKWAQEMRTLIDHPELIKQYPLMHKSQESYANAEDIFFI